MPKDTKTLGNNKARACESLGFVHKKRLCQRFDTTSTFMLSNIYFLCNILYIKVYNIHHFNIRLIIHQSPYSISALLCLLGLKQ